MRLCMCPWTRKARSLTTLVLLWTALTTGGAEASGPAVVSSLLLTPVSEDFEICEGGAAAWGWTSDTAHRNDLYFVSSAGKVKSSWTLGDPIQRVFTISNCKTIWVLSSNLKHLSTINRETDDPHSTPPSVTTDDEIKLVIPSETGDKAWVIYQSRRPDVALAMREGNRVIVKALSGLAKDLQTSYSASAEHGNKLWVVPFNGNGVLLLDGRNVRRYFNVEMAAINASNDQALAWALPRPPRKGVYALTARGEILNQGRPFLDDVEFHSLEIRKGEGAYIWAISHDDQLYVLESRPSGGSWQVKVVSRPRLGGQVRAGTIVSVGDGAAAWLVPPARSGTRQRWNQLWRLEVRDENVEIELVPPDLYDGKPIRQLYWSAEDRGHFWIMNSDLSIYEIAVSAGIAPSTAKKVVDFPLSSLSLEGIYPTNLVNHYWVKTASFCSLMNTAPDIGVAQVVLGDTTFDLETHPLPIIRHQIAAGRTVDASIRLPGVLAVTRAASPAGLQGTAGMHLELTLLKQGGQNASAFAGGEGGLGDGVAFLPLWVNGKRAWGDVFDMELHGHDAEGGSDVRIRWRGIKFSPTLAEAILASPYLKGLVIFLLPTLLLLVVLKKEIAGRRWIPIAIPLLEMLFLKWLPDSAVVSPAELATVACASLAALLPVGAFSPRLFRELASLLPYRLAAPFAMQVRAIRGRVFADYCTELEDRLEILRRDANDESYIAAPVKIVEGSPRTSPPVGATLRVGDVHSLQQDASERSSVLIVAPGGRGKSALWNELLWRSLKAFKADPFCPLPVIGDAGGTTVEKMIEAGLGRYAISAEHTATQLAAGELMVWVDNASTTNLAVSVLEAFLRSKNGEWTRLCLATRPNRDFRAALQQGASKWVAIEPCGLDEESAKAFYWEYAKQDAAHLKKEFNADAVRRRRDRLLPACRGKDGSYLPLLVRLCSRADTDEASSINEIYRITLEKLIERVTGGATEATAKMVRGAEQLALDSYWEDQSRSFSRERPAPEQTQLVDDLLRAGVLAVADSQDWRQHVSSNPQYVRFFHESVQSYLTAKGLANAKSWKCFGRAAGDRDFLKAEIDLGDGVGPELFQMCLHVFEPKWKLRQTLEAELMQWTEIYREVLRIVDVKKGLTPADQLALEAKLTGPPSDASGYLRLAVKLALEEDAKNDSAEHLGRLFAQVAPIAWEQAVANNLVRVA